MPQEYSAPPKLGQLKTQTNDAKANTLAILNLQGLGSVRINGNPETILSCQKVGFSVVCSAQADIRLDRQLVVYGAPITASNLNVLRINVLRSLMSSRILRH
jgi:hypothetical protein